MLDRRLSRLVEVAASIEHTLDLGPVLWFISDLVGIAMVRDQRLAGLFIGPFALCALAVAATSQDMQQPTPTAHPTP